MPSTECLKDTVARVLPYWESTIAPAVRAGKRVLVAAHGNSLRALIKHLDGVSDADIVGLNVPTGVPLVYELDAGLRPLKHYYLGDPAEVAKRVAAVAAQGKAKPEHDPARRVLLLAALPAHGASAVLHGRKILPRCARASNRCAPSSRAAKATGARRATRCAPPRSRFPPPAARCRRTRPRRARRAPPSAELAARRSAQERALESQQDALGRLLAARAVAGRQVAMRAAAPDFVRVALSGEDLADAARRLHYLTYMSRAAARMIEAQRSGLAELAALKESSESKARELAAIETRGRAERELLLKERREHRRLLERIAGEIRDAKKRIQALVADEGRLSRLVEEIGKVLQARPGAGYRQVHARVDSVPDVPESRPGPRPALFPLSRASLRLPVRGELIGRFGTQHAGGTASAKGVFIRAAEGEQVRAVAPGRVVYADWMRGFGNLLIVDHGEGFLSIYGNNESLLKQTGDAVSLGEALATAGQSGGNEETGLYFELRHLGRPFDPISWVKLK